VTENFKMKCSVLLSVVIILSSIIVDAKEASAQKTIKAEKNQPIEIVSNRLDAYSEKRLVVFSGNAIATQGDRIIKSDRIMLYYKKDSREADRIGAGGAGRAGDIEKIEAKGNVTVTQGERIVTGDDAVFYQEMQKIVVTGNAAMREGRNVIQGERIVVLLNENRGIVESGGSKKVKATIYPEDKKEIKK